ncbi:hypothetical protein, partial [Enterobacter hormaechei]|uniref:hypothetical protein n=1 Tax=Enterobacter hormaechei TaxID=158836 RepID=UPI001EDA6EAD
FGDVRHEIFLYRYPLMREKCFGAGSPLSSSREGRRRLGEPLPHQLADNRLPAQNIPVTHHCRSP